MLENTKGGLFHMVATLGLPCQCVLQQYLQLSWLRSSVVLKLWRFVHLNYYFPDLRTLLMNTWKYNSFCLQAIAGKPQSNSPNGVVLVNYN